MGDGELGVGGQKCWHLWRLLQSLHSSAGSGLPHARNRGHQPGLPQCPLLQRVLISWSQVVVDTCFVVFFGVWWFFADLASFSTFLLTAPWLSTTAPWLSVHVAQEGLFPPVTHETACDPGQADQLLFPPTGIIGQECAHTSTSSEDFIEMRRVCLPEPLCLRVRTEMQPGKWRESKSQPLRQLLLKLLPSLDFAVTKPITVFV